MRYKKIAIQTSIFIAVFSTSLMGLVGCQSTSETTTTTSENMPGSGVKVRSSTGLSSEGLLMTEIINIGLEKLGYQTAEIKQLTPPVSYAAVSTGELDFHGSTWEKLHAGLYKNSGGDQKLERVGVVMADGLQGYQIDKKTADQYNITSIDQLQDPEIAELFDSDGDGKANLTGCNPGWVCALVIENHLEAYELQDTVEHNQGEYETLLVDTLTRYRDGKPILYYAYVPHWSASILEVDKDAVWLEVPFTALPEGQENVTEQETSFDGKNLGFAVDQVRVLANKEFIDNNPVAKRFFESVSIPIEDINEQQKLVYDGENSPEDIRRHAEEWVQNNQQQFDSWVEEATETVQ